MPMINLQCSKPVPEELLQALSTAVAESLGKPEQYVMIAASVVTMIMSGAEGDAAYVEIKSLGGLNRVVNHEMTMKICILLSDHLDIPARRTYVTFQSMERDHWGWNGSTFG